MQSSEQSLPCGLRLESIYLYLALPRSAEGSQEHRESINTRTIIKGSLASTAQPRQPWFSMHSAHQRALGEIRVIRESTLWCACLLWAELQLFPSGLCRVPSKTGVLLQKLKGGHAQVPGSGQGNTCEWENKEIVCLNPCIFKAVLLPWAGQARGLKWQKYVDFCLCGLKFWLVITKAHRKPKKY